MCVKVYSHRYVYGTMFSVFNFLVYLPRYTKLNNMKTPLLSRHSYLKLLFYILSSAGFLFIVAFATKLIKVPLSYMVSFVLFYMLACITLVVQREADRKEMEVKALKQRLNKVAWIQANKMQKPLAHIKSLVTIIEQYDGKEAEQFIRVIKESCQVLDDSIKETAQLAG